MTLIKTSLLNAIAVIVKMLTLLGINKILAIYVGPAGYAALGQFQNAVQMITTFASGAINVGVTKYTAEYFDDEEKQRAVWRTAGTLALVSSILTAFFISIFSEKLAVYFLKDVQYENVFIWFSLTLIFFVFNTLLLSILNGKKEISLYVLANIAGSIFSILVISLLVMQFGLYGALVGLVVYQSLSFFALCYSKSWFKVTYFFGKIEKVAALNLAKYAAMALTTAACVPLSHIFIRNYIGEQIGWVSAGYWEAMWRLSAAYLMLVTTTLGVYYLPKLAELNSHCEIKLELNKGFKLIVPVTIILGGCVYLFRDLIIELLFSSEFKPMEELFAWQMVGDCLKIASWLVGYLFLSKARFKLIMFIEVYFSIQHYLLVRYFVDSYGLYGTSVAHFVNYSICLMFVLYILMFRWEKKSVG